MIGGGACFDGRVSSDRLVQVHTRTQQLPDTYVGMYMYVGTCN